MANKIIGTGLSGLVGSRITELLKDTYEFEDISRKTGTDITDGTALRSRMEYSDAPVILHVAAFTNVDGAQEQKDLGEESDAWKINVVGTENVTQAAEETGKKLIFISTDFVFDGKNTPEGGYTETDIPSPVNWYAQTKYEAELRVAEAQVPWLIVRIAYPYRAAFEKNDFFRAIKARLEQKQPIAAITDHIYCPTFIDDIAFGLDTLIQQDATGIYHMTGSEALSPYDAAQEIAATFDLDTNRITTTTREEYFKGKAERPFDLSMNNAKIKSLGVGLKGFREGLQEIKKQL